MKNLPEDTAKEFLAWIKDSEDQNEFCEHSILVDAIDALHENPPNVEKALGRLFEITPVQGSYVLVNPPEFAIDIEEGKL